MGRQGVVKGCFEVCCLNVCEGVEFCVVLKVEEIVIIWFQYLEGFVKVYIFVGIEYYVELVDYIVEFIVWYS